MKTYSLFRHIVSTSLYIVVLFFVLWGNNLLINWSLKNFILPFFSWFYGIGVVYKIFFILGLGTITRLVLFGLFMWVAAIVGRILSYMFIFNKGAYWISIIMVMGNIIFSAIDMWRFIQFDFWSIAIWLMLFYFVFQMSWSFVFKDREQIELENYILEQQRLNS